MRRKILLFGALTGVLLVGRAFFPREVEGQSVATTAATQKLSPEQSAHIEAGNTSFQQKCAFCHGRDAGGGETGPDLTRSKLVLEDVNGNKIGDVVKNGRAGRMPPFDIAGPELENLVAFIHSQAQKAAMSGKRKGVDVSDLQTGNLDAGKKYFEGAGGCSKCHSATGDLAHIATKYEGLQLMERMLYPRGAKSKATVTTASGEKLTGVVEYQDEFVLGIIPEDGRYRSWPVSKIKYTIDAPHQAHVEQFSKYTDDDIHNLMAYLQTLR